MRGKVLDFFGFLISFCVFLLALVSGFSLFGVDIVVKQSCFGIDYWDSLLLFHVCFAVSVMGTFDVELGGYFLVDRLCFLSLLELIL